MARYNSNGTLRYYFFGTNGIFAKIQIPNSITSTNVEFGNSIKYVNYGIRFNGNGFFGALIKIKMKMELLIQHFLQNGILKFDNMI
jgi:hypothetical protein